MKYLVILSLLFAVPAFATGGHDHDKPKPVPVVVQSPAQPLVVQSSAQPQGDNTHHESRSSKLAKVVGVVALVTIVYHVTWGGTPEQNKAKVEFRTTGTKE